MKLARFLYKRKVYWGIVEDERVHLLKDNPFKKIVRSARCIRLGEVKLLPPACASKIILVGLNYRDHARELKMKIPKEPLIFLKPPSALIGHNQPIRYPAMTKRLDYEAELAVVIKKRCRNIRVGEVHKYIMGYTCLNDVTARDLQAQDGQWTRAKSFDTFSPLGPWIETGFKPKDRSIELYLNGERKQCSSTKHFIFSVTHLVAFISKIMTLEAQDVISTGTPPGVGPMKVGDQVEVAIEGIGRLCNAVTSS